MLNKSYLFFLLFMFSIFIYSQNKIEKDSLLIKNKEFYIQNHNKQLNIKFDVSKEQVQYFFPYESKKATIKTNLNTSLGFVLSYKFLSVRLGIRPSLSKSERQNKGETDYFRLKVKLLFDHWTHRIEYDYARGFYIDNTNDYRTNTLDSEFRIQFPNLTTNIISGSTQYNFNNLYSIKAVESNTEIQLKSTGTFLVGLNYSFYDLAGANKVIVAKNEVIYKPNYVDYNGISLVLNAGYHYTFVFKKYGYVNLRADPGVGIDFYKNTFNFEDERVANKNNDVFFALGTGIAIGYNGEKYYAGIEYNYNINSQKFNNENFSLQPIKNNFNVFIGYRFKPPKQLSKPIDLIEDKVPILKDKN